MDDLERRVVERLSHGTSLEGLGLGRVGGRWDLRGMRFSDVERRPGPAVGGYSSVGLAGFDQLNNVRLEGLDLTGAVWESLRLTSVEVSDCVLDGARLYDLRMWDSHWHDCSLRATRLRSGSMGGTTPLWRRSRTTSWKGVDFTEADLRDSAHQYESYTDCDFSRARLDGVDFDGARHVRSRFAGRVEDVSFRRRPLLGLSVGPVNAMLDVDFTEAQLVGCGFWDLDLRQVKLPSTEEHVIARPKVAVARRVLELLATAELTDALIGLRVAMEFWQRTGPDTVHAWGVVDRAFLSESPEELLRAIALLDQAIAEVAGPMP